MTSLFKWMAEQKLGENSKGKHCFVLQTIGMGILTFDFHCTAYISILFYHQPLFLHIKTGNVLEASSKKGFPFFYSYSNDNKI